MGAEPRTALDFELSGYEEPSFDWVEGYKAGTDAGVAVYKAELAEKVRALYVIRFGDPEMASRNTIAAVIALMEESE